MRIKTACEKCLWLAFTPNPLMIKSPKVHPLTHIIHHRDMSSPPPTPLPRFWNSQNSGLKAGKASGTGRLMLPSTVQTFRHFRHVNIMATDTFPWSSCRFLNFRVSIGTRSLDMCHSWSEVIIQKGIKKPISVISECAPSGFRTITIG